MTTGSNNKPAEGNRENTVEAARDKALIKQLETAIYAIEAWQKALDVLCKRIASREVSGEMLLRIVASLSKSTSLFLKRRP